MGKIILFELKGPSSHGVTGGAEVYSEELANVLASMDYEVEIYCGRDKGEEELSNFEQRSAKVSVRRFKSPFDFLPFALLPMHWYYLRKGRKEADFIIENQTVVPLLTAFYKKGLFTIIHHLTGKDYIRKQGKIKGSIGIFSERVVIPLFYKKENILTVSNHSKNSIAATGIKANHITIISPIVSTLSKQFNYSTQRENIISYVGRYTGKGGNKRIDHVIEIMPQIVSKVPDVKLIIGGSMKNKEELQEIINREHLQEYVEFHGFLTDEEKAKLLSQSKVFASPSYQEGFGITYIEAQSFGTPVVGYKIDGLDTVPPTSGIMVNRDDKEDLAKAIIELLTDDDEWVSKSCGSLQNASLYSASKIREEYKQYILERIGSR